MSPLLYVSRGKGNNFSSPRVRRLGKSRRRPCWWLEAVIVWLARAKMGGEGEGEAVSVINCRWQSLYRGSWGEDSAEFRKRLEEVEKHQRQPASRATPH